MRQSARNASNGTIILSIMWCSMKDHLYLQSARNLLISGVRETLLEQQRMRLQT